MFESKELDVIVLAPINFAEIVAKTKHSVNPITATDCERNYAENQKNDQQGFVFVAQYEWLID